MKTVKEIMATFPEYVVKHESLQTAAEHMVNANIGCLAVVDEDDKLVGIITDRDIAMTAASHRNKKLSDIKISDVLGKRPLYTVFPNDNLEIALQVMRTKQVGRLPVVDKENKLLGVVSLNHIVRQLYSSHDYAEIVYKGIENVMNTLYAIATRKEFVFTS